MGILDTVTSAVQNFRNSDFGQRLGGDENHPSAMARSQMSGNPIQSEAPKVSTAGDPNVNAMAMKLVTGQDKGFYGHMTVEKCYQMSGTKGSLKTDKSSFTKNSWNGLHASNGKKAK